MPQVSVIVLTYNADNIKLRRTLASIAAQKEIDQQILICDDGSAKKNFAFLPEFCKQIGIDAYQLIENPENRGTVYNCLSGICAATGEYVFLTSPGDYLYDPYTLRDFFQFAKTNQARLVFGNAVYYNNDNPEPVLTRSQHNVYAPQMYAANIPDRRSKTHFFAGNWIIGASYFRHRQTALTLLQQLAGQVIYIEDNTSTALAMAAGIGLNYYNRNIVWYEDGTGVSTGANQAWTEKLHKDTLAAYRIICQKYPHDPYAHYAKNNYEQSNKLLRILSKCFRHPVITVRSMLGKRLSNYPPIHCTQQDMQYLRSLCRDDFCTKE